MSVDIDKAIAEKVMKLETADGRKIEVREVYTGHGKNGYETSISIEDNDYAFMPSYHISDAWLVVEKMKEQGFLFRIEISMDDGKYIAQFFNRNTKKSYIDRAETAPLAICKAAKKAVV